MLGRRYGSMLTLLSGDNFNPRSLPNLNRWYDAADTLSITQSGGLVSQWNDKSGNGHHATQSTDANKPTTGTATLNGRNVLSCDGGDLMTMNAWTPSASGFTIFAVAKNTDFTNGSIILGRNGAGNNYIYITNTNTFAVAWASSNTTSIHHPSGEWGIYAATHSASGAGNTTLYSNERAGSAVALTASLQFDRLFYYSSAAVQMEGMCAEILIYDRVLSATEIAQVRRYLNTKWAVYNATEEAVRTLNPAVWLAAQYGGRSDSIVLNTTTVSTWRNLGTQGVGNATQGTATNQPLFAASIINGRPAVQGRHDGTNASSLSIADATGLDYLTFASFTVIRRVSDLGTRERIAGKYSASGTLREHSINIGIAPAGNLLNSISPDGNSGTIVESQTSQALALSTTALVTGRFNGTDTITELNGANTGTAAVAAVQNSTSPYFLFSRDGNNEPFAGYIAEHLFFNADLSAANIAVVETYLGAKWGIAL